MPTMGFNTPFEPLIDGNEPTLGRIDENKVGFKRGVQHRKDGEQNHVQDRRYQDFHRP